MIDSMIITYVLSALAVLIILTIHELAHGYAAYKLGDPTAKNLGRLTLNPLKHLDPIGALFLIFFRFGWAKPVPINARNFKNPKRDFAITALAGPVTNLIMAFLSSFIYLLLFRLLRGVAFESELLLALAQNSLDFLYIFFIINLGIAVFNLLPIPPLDGSRVLGALLPPKAYFGLMKHERNIYLVFIVWLIGGNLISRAMLSLPLVAASPVLSFIARILSLSGLISDLISLIAKGIIGLWQLIPFLA